VKDAFQKLASVQNAANQIDAKKGINEDNASYSDDGRLFSPVPFLKLEVETCTGRLFIAMLIICQPWFRPARHTISSVWKFKPGLDRAAKRPISPRQMFNSFVY